MRATGGLGQSERRTVRRGAHGATFVRTFSSGNGAADRLAGLPIHEVFISKGATNEEYEALSSSRGQCCRDCFRSYNPTLAQSAHSGNHTLEENKSSFKWRHFEPTIILLCVRWYCRYQLSYRDVAEMMRERGLDVDHSTVFRWVQRYAPEINKRARPHLKVSGTSYRVDETYIKVGKACKYLYRAVDKEGQTVEFMLSAKRDVPVVKRFFKSRGKTVL